MLRNTDNVENHMVLNGPDAPWNQPDADPETPEERKERERIEARDLAAAEFADGLRQIADLIEEHPELKPTLDVLHTVYSEREEFLRAVTLLKEDSRVGDIRKYTNEPDDERWAEFRAERKFGPVRLTLCIKRKLICRLVKAAQPAVYDCPDSLLEAASEYTARG